MRSTTPVLYLNELAARPDKVRILVAEDDSPMRTLIARQLRAAGHEVDEAPNGNAALDRIADAMLLQPPQPYDLLIADIRMPGTSGLQVLSAVRELDWHTPVILITAFGDEETHAEAERLGAYALFDKPFDLDDLGTAVVNALPATGAFH